MPLQTSGQISLADVAAELGRAAGATISLNDARALAGIDSGPISLRDLYGKSAAITITISSNTTDKQLGAEIAASGASVVNVIIPAGVELTSSNASIPAISFDGAPATTTIILENHGSILGKGGTGGKGGSVRGSVGYDGWHGQHGGTAIRNGDNRLTIKNHGIVQAGSGGGGGGGGVYKMTSYGPAFAAGGGGGGGRADGVFGYGGLGGTTSDGHKGNGSMGSTGSSFIIGIGGSSGKWAIGNGYVGGGDGGNGGNYGQDGSPGHHGAGHNNTAGGWGGMAGWSSYGHDTSRITWEEIGTRTGPVFVSKNTPEVSLTATISDSWDSPSNHYAVLPPVPKWMSAGKIPTDAAPAGKTVNRIEVMGMRTDRVQYTHNPLSGKPWTAWKLEFRVTETGANMGLVEVGISGDRYISFEVLDIWPDLQYKLHYSDGSSSDFVRLFVNFIGDVEE